MHERRDRRRSHLGLATVVVVLAALAGWSWHRSIVSATLDEARFAAGARWTEVVHGDDGAASRRTAEGPGASLLHGLRGLPGDGSTLTRTVPALPPAEVRVARDPALEAAAPQVGVERPACGDRLSHERLPLPGLPERSEATTAFPSSRREVRHSAELARCWPLPTTVLAALEGLRARRVADTWATRTETQLHQLHACPALNDPRAAQALRELAELVAAASQVAAEQIALEDRADVLRTAFAIERRLAVWRGVHQLAMPPLTPVSMTSTPQRDAFDTALLDQQIERVTGAVARLEHADQWREYLLLDQLDELAGQRWAAHADARSQVAREILTRLELARETSEQERFFDTPPWQELAGQLRRWVTVPIDYTALLDDLERLEASGSQDAARRVAEQYEQLRWSWSPPLVELSQAFNTYYRNANVRVAISAELVNRLLPAPDTVDEDIDDMLLGGRIFGRSRVSTRLRLVLFPDRQQWKMAIEAQGNVNSQTSTKRGPAVFHNAARARYLALKLLTVDQRGLRTEEAEAAAVSNADLTRLETDVDAVPLVNLLVRMIARQQYDSQSGAAKSEAEGLLVSRAQSRLNEEVDRQLNEATVRYRRQVLEPLQRLGLRPQTVDLETTEHRLIARYRLAGSQQMAAFTPRPQATADSLLSVQVHESAMNNLLASLELNATETDLPTLFTQVAQKFGRESYQLPEEVPTDVRIRLAETDPIRVTCADDRLHVTLRIARLEGGDDTVWRDFEVRAAYALEVQGLHVRLVRDGHVCLKGRRLSMRDQVALRGIFSRVLAQHPAVDMFDHILARDRRLRGLCVTQVVMRDGWLGLSVGRRPPAKASLADGAIEQLRG